jgi:hypothetical protein
MATSDGMTARLAMRAEAIVPRSRYSREPLPGWPHTLFEGHPWRVLVGPEECRGGWPIPAPGSKLYWRAPTTFCDEQRTNLYGRVADVASRDHHYHEALRALLNVCARFDLVPIGHNLLQARTRTWFDPRAYDADRSVLTIRRPATDTWEVTFGPSARDNAISRHGGGPPPAGIPRAAPYLAWVVPPRQAYATEPDALSALWQWQQGRCALCAKRAAELDHDHATGLVRGWLCSLCNMRCARYARFQASPFCDYAKHPPTVLLGIVLQWRPVGQRGFRIPTP